MILQRTVPQRIAIFRALQLGDLLCAVPALRALRSAFPHGQIVLIGLSSAAQLVRRFSHLLDGFIEFPGYPGLPESRPRLHLFPDFLSEIQGTAFDYVIQMHGDGTITNPLVTLFGAKLTAGFFRPGSFCPNEQSFMPYPSGESEIRVLIKLMEFFGAPAKGEHLEFPLTNSDFMELLANDGSETFQSKYVCIHPGARLPSRRWNIGSFAAVGDMLASQGFRIVLTGSQEEAPLTREVACAMRYDSLDLGGRTSLGSLAALISKAHLVVCNDTGTSHIAAALDVPSVVIACGSDVVRWAPLNRSLHRVLSRPMSCRPCQYFDCPLDNHPCANSITIDDVITEGKDLLKAGRAASV